MLFFFFNLGAGGKNIFLLGVFYAGTTFRDKVFSSV